VEFGDPQFAVTVRDGVTRIEELIRRELWQGDGAIRDAMPRSSAAGGIRFRPLFTVLSAQFGPHADAQQITVAGAALELMHLATICHAEVVDLAEVGPGSAGASAIRQTNNVAILAGDYRFATVSRLGSWLGRRAFQVIADTFAELVAGQMRETLGAPTHVDRLAHYLQCVWEKTGSLVAAAGQLGATFSGASEDESLRLARLGRLVGTAIQISDDINARGEMLLRSSPGLIEAKEAVAGYAAQAHEELACLPDCAGRRTLATLIDCTIS